MSRKYPLFLILIFIALSGQELLAQQNVFLPMHASRIRAVGIAGAYQAVYDDLAALSYNPASYSVYRDAKNFRITFFLTPAAPMIIYRNPDRFYARPARQGEKNFAAIFSLFKAINFTYKDLDFGFVFGEPIFSTQELLQAKQALHLNHVYNNHYHTAALHLRLAEQVSLGVSLYLNYFEPEHGQRDWALSASYGVILQPNDYLRVGVSLFSAASKLPRNYEFIDQKYNDALGLGLAVQAPWRMQFSFDVRNLTVNQDVVGERLLAGVEQQILGHIAVRAGLQYHTNDQHFAQTFGLGLLNLSRFRGDRDQFKHTEYAVNYALVRKKLFEELYFIHAFSLQVRI